MVKVDALILAGAPADPKMDPSGLLQSRALVPLAGRTMLDWVVDALRAARSVGRIAAAGRVQSAGIDLVVEPADSLVENICLGLEALETDEPVLLVSADIPLLTAEAVDDFVERAVLLEADLVYPIVPRSRCEQEFPGLRRTCVRTAEGEFTGGNIMLVKPDFIRSSRDTVTRAYEARKQPLRLARMIGLGILARTLVGQLVPSVLSISLLERAASRVLGARVAALISQYPEIGEDVDKPEDLEAVSEILSRDCRVGINFYEQ